MAEHNVVDLVAAGCAAVEWGPGDNPGVRVLNLAGVGQSGWDIIEDSIDEVRFVAVANPLLINPLSQDHGPPLI